MQIHVKADVLHLCESLTLKYLSSETKQTCRIMYFKTYVPENGSPKRRGKLSCHVHFPVYPDGELVVGLVLHHDGDLTVTLAHQAAVVDVGRADDHCVVVHYQQFTVHIHQFCDLWRITIIIITIIMKIIIIITT